MATHFTTIVEQIHKHSFTAAHAAVDVESFDLILELFALPAEREPAADPGSLWRTVTIRSFVKLLQLSNHFQLMLVRLENFFFDLSV